MAIKLADQLRFSTPSPNNGGSGPMQQAGEKKPKKKKKEGEATTLRGEEGGAYDGVDVSDLGGFGGY